MILAAVDLEGCKQIGAQIEQAGSHALAVACNVADHDAVEAAVAQDIDHFDRLDILVNNASVLRDNLLFRMSDDDWDTVLSVHLKGAFLCSRAAQKHMVEPQYGRIVSLSSGSALGTRGQANYSTAKAGRQGLTRTLASELGPFGITANAVAPGFIDTQMTRSTAHRQGLDPDQVSEKATKTIPVRRVGQPRDIGNAVGFLAAEDTGCVNGQIT